MGGRWIGACGAKGKRVDLSSGPQGGGFGIVNEGSGFRRGYTGGAQLGSSTSNLTDFLTKDPVVPEVSTKTKKPRKSRAKPKPTPKTSIWQTLPVQLD